MSAMQENEFEQQLRQQMQQLLLPPTEAAWPAIAAQLAEKKRKKRWLIWGCLAALLLAGGSFFVYQYSSTPATATANAATKNSEIPNLPALPAGQQQTKKTKLVTPILQPDNTIKKQSITAALPQGSKNVSGTTNFAQSKPVVQNNTSAYQKLRKQVQARTKISILSSAVGDNVPLDNATAGKAQTKLIDMPDSPSETILNPTTEQATTTSTVTKTHTQKNSPIAQNDTATLTTPTAEQKNIVAPVAEERNKIATNIEKFDSSLAIANATKKNTPKKWLFTVGVYGGLSGAIHSNLSSEKVFADQMANPSPSSPMNGLDNSIAFRNTVNKSIGGGISFVAFRYIAPKWLVGAGLQYHWLRQQVLTGADSAIVINNEARFARTAGSTQFFTNQYHYISIPVLVKWQPNQKIAIEGGINVQQLLGSNALQYFEERRVYYTENSLLNKTSVGLQAAVDFTVFSTPKGNFTLGPVMYYTLSNISHSGVYSASRHWLAGIRLQKTFK
jgi:hypothetical protein